MYRRRIQKPNTNTRDDFKHDNNSHMGGRIHVDEQAHAQCDAAPADEVLHAPISQVFIIEG